MNFKTSQFVFGHPVPITVKGKLLKLEWEITPLLAYSRDITTSDYHILSNVYDITKVFFTSFSVDSTKQSKCLKLKAKFFRHETSYKFER